MKFQELLDQYPRIKIADPRRQDTIFSLIDQTSISSESLQISFDRRPDFYYFLKAQGERAFVFIFVNKDGVPHGFAVSTFRKLSWNGQQISIGYTSDLRTTPQLDREARLQWRKFYGHALQLSETIDEFEGCIGFITLVWKENKLAQKALIQKKRPGGFSYEMTNTYQSHSVWGRWWPLRKPKSTVRLIKESEISTLIKLLCRQDKLSWIESDLVRTLSIFKKSFKDFQVLDENGIANAFVLPVSASHVKKTLIKKWPLYLNLMTKLLPLFGKRSVELNQPIEILQLMLFKSVVGSEDEQRLQLLQFIDHFWYQNNKSPKNEQFSILSVHRWDQPNQKNLSLNRKGYLVTSIEGALYKVIPEVASVVTLEKSSTKFSEMNDFSHLEIGFL